MNIVNWNDYNRAAENGAHPRRQKHTENLKTNSCLLKRQNDPEK